MKKCPYCAEEIQDDAIKCRFCGEQLKKKWWKNCFIGCLAMFLLSLVLVFLFFYFSFFLLKFIVYKLFFAPPQLPRYYYPPSTAWGLEQMLRDFAQFFKFLWEKLIEFFQFGAKSHYI